MKNISTFLLTVLVCVISVLPVMAEEQTPKKWMVGTELDFLPFISDGYYLSAVVGYAKWRARFVRASFTTPDFATPSGFKDNDLDANAYIIDYYFKEGFKGWWLGSGYESWDGEVEEKSSGLKRSYRTDIFTLGGGYTFRFNDHFYINPWAAVHVPIGGDKDVQFANDTFKIRATPEVSIKIGANY